MIRLAAYQGRCTDDPTTNIATVRRIITQAETQGCDFLCFPEGYLSNYKADYALSLTDPRVVDLIEESRAHGMVLIVGLSEQEGEAVFNTALVVHEGQLLGKYRKTMLTGSDKRQFAPDYDLPVFDAKGIRFGVIICHDSSFIEPAYAMRCQGARLLFSPHYNSIGYDHVDEHRLHVRNNHIGLASLLKMVVVRANVIGGDTERLGYGDSAIFSPLGIPVAEAPLFRGCLLTADFVMDTFQGERWASRNEVPDTVCTQLARILEG